MAIVNASRVAQRRANYALIAQVKSRPCTDCGVRYPQHVMDFDHVRGEKCGVIGRMVNVPVSTQTLLNEIAKCEVVCANCHRERTQQRRSGRHANKQPQDGKWVAGDSNPERAD